MAEPAESASAEPDAEAKAEPAVEAYVLYPSNSLVTHAHIDNVTHLLQRRPHEMYANLLLCVIVAVQSRKWRDHGRRGAWAWRGRCGEAA